MVRVLSVLSTRYLTKWKINAIKSNVILMRLYLDQVFVKGVKFLRYLIKIKRVAKNVIYSKDQMKMVRNVSPQFVETTRFCLEQVNVSSVHTQQFQMNKRDNVLSVPHIRDQIFKELNVWFHFVNRISSQTEVVNVSCALNIKYLINREKTVLLSNANPMK